MVEHKKKLYVLFSESPPFVVEKSLPDFINECEVNSIYKIILPSTIYPCVKKGAGTSCSQGTENPIPFLGVLQIPEDFGFAFRNSYSVWQERSASHEESHTDKLILPDSG